MKYPFNYDDIKEEYKSLYIFYKDLYLKKHPKVGDAQCSDYAAKMVQKRARKLYNYRVIIKKIKENAKLCEIMNLHKSCSERESNGSYYKFLEDILIKSNSVIDIGCGLNPCMVLSEYSNISQYFCYDKDEHILKILQLINNHYLNNKLILLTDATWNELIISGAQFDLLLVQKLIPTLYNNHNTKTLNKIAKINAQYYFISGSIWSLSRNISIQNNENEALEWFINRYKYKKILYVQTSNEYGWLLSK